MRQKMSIQSRRELLDQVIGRYRKTVRKKEKQKILDEFVGSSKYHRKYAVMLLNHGTFHCERKPRRVISHTPPSLPLPLWCENVIGGRHGQDFVLARGTLASV